MSDNFLLDSLMRARKTLPSRPSRRKRKRKSSFDANYRPRGALVEVRQEPHQYETRSCTRNSTSPLVRRVSPTRKVPTDVVTAPRITKKRKVPVKASTLPPPKSWKVPVAEKRIAAKKPVTASNPVENAVKVAVIIFKKSLKTAQKKAASEKPPATLKVLSVIPKARFLSPDHIENDQEKQLVYEKGDVIKHRYQITETLGEGVFGTVVSVIDMEDKNKEKALKIIRDTKDLKDSTEYEIDVLKRIRTKDPWGMFSCVTMLDSFDYYGHPCILFEKLGGTLLQFLDGPRFQFFCVGQVRQIAYQLLFAVSFLHSCGIIHTDLKPENILFRDISSSFLKKRSGKLDLDGRQIRLIDFGNAVFSGDGSEISTAHYRAPEVILGLDWSCPADMWSVGCIIYELYTRDLLFDSSDGENLRHLASMEMILGPIPRSMILNSSKKFYRMKGADKYKLKWKKGTEDNKELVKNCKPLMQLTSEIDEDTMALFHLLKGLLELNPRKRLTALEALSHPFFEKWGVKVSFVGPGGV